MWWNTGNSIVQQTTLANKRDDQSRISSIYYLLSLPQIFVLVVNMTETASSVLNFLLKQLSAVFSLCVNGSMLEEKEKHEESNYSQDSPLYRDCVYFAFADRICSVPGFISVIAKLAVKNALPDIIATVYHHQSLVRSIICNLLASMLQRGLIHTNKRL